MWKHDSNTQQQVSTPAERKSNAHKHGKRKAQVPINQPPIMFFIELGKNLHTDTGEWPEVNNFYKSTFFLICDLTSTFDSLFFFFFEYLGFSLWKKNINVFTERKYFRNPKNLGESLSLNKSNNLGTVKCGHTDKKKTFK